MEKMKNFVIYAWLKKLKAKIYMVRRSEKMLVRKW
jgi:hypothetical protein